MPPDVSLLRLPSAMHTTVCGTRARTASPHTRLQRPSAPSCHRRSTYVCRFPPRLCRRRVGVCQASTAMPSPRHAVPCSPPTSGRRNLRLVFALGSAAILLAACAVAFVVSVATVAAALLSDTAPPPLVDQPTTSSPPASTSTPTPSPPRPNRSRGCRGGRRS
eukprot:5679360-Pleurochrysis_carterae.AAC.1